ncbi:UDP-glucose:glycoprotein glucosyltransferase 1 [Nymphon striatum]|nr:UDP-glucose:glycoprotein glucosyltransferase 1 [Nymphon striatum]
MILKFSKWMLNILVVLALSNLFSTVNSRQAKSVSVVLDAKWKSTSLLLETSEFLASENPSLMWVFIDRICDKYEKIAQKTDQEIYESSMKEVEELISLPQISLLRFYLSLRYFSPKVEMFQQIALDQNLPDCEAVVNINGKVTCNVDEIAELIANAQDSPKCSTYKVDHHYISGMDSAAVTAVLYGEIGTASFVKMHDELKKYANERTIDYILRHYLKKRSEDKVRLSGYGVELAIKSTEYKAQDDTKVKSDNEGKIEEDVDDIPFQGLVFSTLKKKYPGLKDKLEELKNEMLSESSELVPLKKWEIQSVSLQAAQKIMSAPTEDAINVMIDIAQNFPTRVRSLVKVQVDEKLKQEISKNQNSFQHNHEISITDGALFINGIQFDMDNTDIFSLVEILNSEVKTMNSLHSFGLKGDVLKNIMKLDLKPKQEWAVDIRDSAVMVI